MKRQNKTAPDQSLAFRDLEVTHRDVDVLKPFERNARTHSRRQIRQIARSIEAFGFTNPILIDETDRIIAGHGRVEAARLLGITQIPTIRLDHLSEAQLRAYVIADNKLAENAGWDRDILAIEFQFLSGLDLEFDVTVTGFEMAEIDLIIEGSVPDEEDVRADALPEVSVDTPQVTRLGDLWILGMHRLLCGDATDPASFKRLLGEDRAQMVITDPPYNVPIEGHACGSGQIKHLDFVMAAGEMTEEEFTDFLSTVIGLLVRYSMDGSIHFVFMDWRHIHELLAAARSTYAE
ncbi:MAG: ParB N-terminal domain-containing protein, partial [Acidimicrobiia bacterium]